MVSPIDRPCLKTGHCGDSGPSVGVEPDGDDKKRGRRKGPVSPIDLLLLRLSAWGSRALPLDLVNSFNRTMLDPSNDIVVLLL